MEILCHILNAPYWGRHGLALSEYGCLSREVSPQRWVFFTIYFFSLRVEMGKIGCSLPFTRTPHTQLRHNLPEIFHTRLPRTLPCAPLQPPFHRQSLNPSSGQSRKHILRLFFPWFNRWQRWPIYNVLLQTSRTPLQMLSQSLRGELWGVLDYGLTLLTLQFLSLEHCTSWLIIKKSALFRFILHIE